MSTGRTLDATWRPARWSYAGVGAEGRAPQVPDEDGWAVGEEQRRPSLKDVARVAGVSYQTVSRVINGGPRVSEDTRERVQAVVDQLGYRRNEAARALVTSRSHTIGVIADASPRYGPVSTLAAVESAARQAGYTALVTTVSHPGLEPVVEVFQVQAAINSRPRKALGWKTPAEALDEQPRSLQQGSVASTN